MSVKPPAEKKFRRANARPGKRKSPTWTVHAWRAARWGLALALMIYAGFRGTALVLHASVLQVRTINVHGNVRLSSGEVQVIVDGLRGANILTVDLSGYRTRLLDSPWVASAALRRVLPATVEVFVAERRPIGIGRLTKGLYLVDGEGVIIDEYGPQYAEFDLPIVDGLERAPGSGEPTVDEDRAALAARVLEALAPRRDLAKRLSQVDVHDVHDAVVLLDGEPALLHLGEDRFLERLQGFMDLAPALHAQVADIDYVDLRFGDRVYVRPQKAEDRRRKKED